MVSDLVIQTIVQLVCVHSLDGLLNVNVTLHFIFRLWNALLPTVLLSCTGLFARLVLRCKRTHHYAFTVGPIYGSIGLLRQYTAVIARLAMVLHCTRSIIRFFEDVTSTGFVRQELRDCCCLETQEKYSLRISYFRFS